MRTVGPLPSVDRLRALLAETDADLDARGPRRTLAPDRAEATRLVALFDAHAGQLPAAARAGFARGLRRVARAQLEAFPGNLFWDFDALAARIASEARTHGVDGVAELTALVAALQHLFGRETPIRFRYVHDFTYGFDWAKWVRRAPKERASVGPFDRPFLRYMWRRGHELLALIAADDAKYPRLRDERPRNPFGFSREPRDEERLFRDLAARDLLPVPAWEPAPRARWDRPFYELRAVRAEALNLGG